MEERAIGRVSATVVGLGCNQFGTKACDEATARQVIEEALDAGISWFDTADEYGSNYFDPTDPGGWGGSEEVLGRVLRGRRDEVRIATKFGVHPHGETERGGASARWCHQAIDDSLRRLQTDHVDLYQLHFPDPDVPIEETLGAMEELVQAGKVLEIGCANFSAEQLREAAEAASSSGGSAFASLQSALNLMQRGALDEVLPTCVDLRMAFIPYYPLASGMLTGKYRRGEPLPASTRLTEQVDDAARERLFSDRTFTRLEALEGWAGDHGHTLLELAFAWLLAQPSVTTVIAGAAKSGQAASNAAAGHWRLTAEQAAEVTSVVAGAV